MIWHAVTCTSGAERVVAGRIRPLLAAVLVPTQVIVPARGLRPKPLRRAIVPGYVWIGAEGPVPWPAVLADRDVRRPLGLRDGEPYVFPARDIERLREIEAELAAVPVVDRRGRVYRPGERVTLRSGALAGRTVRVSEDRGARVLAVVGMLGRLHEVELGKDVLGAAA